MNYLKGKTILITGGAGFIGFHFAHRLMQTTDCRIIIIDNLNDYYSVDLKKDRLKQLGFNLSENKHPKGHIFYRIDISDSKRLRTVFDENKIDIVVNLAAQAGVRYAKTNPRVYIESNIDGLFNILEESDAHKVDLLLYASSSSIYGNDSEIPFKESSTNLQPLSLYAATKLSGELMAQTFSQSTSLHAVGLRFFNVYGPWGRPDMAYFKWSTALKEDKLITIHGEGKMLRDMTYIDDVTEAMIRLIGRYAPMSGAINSLGIYENHEVFNIGNSDPTVIQHVFDFLSNKLGRTGRVSYVQKGEEEADTTYADTNKLRQAVGFTPHTDVELGLGKFTDWFKDYYKV